MLEEKNHDQRIMTTLRFLIAFLSSFLILFLFMLYYLNTSPTDMKDGYISVKKGSAIRTVGYQLKKMNFITNESFFRYLAVFKNSKIITGKYNISKGMTSHEILNRFSKGEVLRRKVTIPEGFNLFEIATALEVNNICSSKDFLFYSFDSDFLHSIGIFSQSAEGYLYPDTYIFEEEINAREIIKIMHRQLMDVLRSVDLSNLDRLKLNKKQLLILSSIIEKEAKIPSERVLISAVFHNRLKRGIPLYSDPTIRYALKKFKGRITYEDLKYDSLFNTRIYKGLTPTPICSSGKDSIIAALNPANSNFLYFVARNDGTHYFSETLREHNQAVNYYQKGINNGFIDERFRTIGF